MPKNTLDRKELHPRLPAERGPIIVATAMVYAKYNINIWSKLLTDQMKFYFLFIHKMFKCPESDALSLAVVHEGHFSPDLSTLTLKNNFAQAVCLS